MLTRRSLPGASTCILCRSKFDGGLKAPCPQTCQHSICLECIETKTNSEDIICPIDSQTFKPSKHVQHLLIMDKLEPTSRDHDMISIESSLDTLATMLKPSHPNFNMMSVQLKKKLSQLVESTFHQNDGKIDFIKRLASLFNRILLELVQALYSTKQGEKRLEHLINSKGCSISNPDLTDKVIDLLLKLYEAAGQCADTSFERNVLIKFILKEIGQDTGANKRQVERIIQTLYWASCFHVIKRVDAPGRLKLKDDLHTSADVRRQHDVEIIKLAQTEHIRLCPESWARLLYSHYHLDHSSRMQSLLDRYQSPVLVTEIKSLLNSDNLKYDRYNLTNHMDDLFQIEVLINKCSNNLDRTEDVDIRTILEKLVSLRHLFVLRHCRAQRQSIIQSDV